MKIISYTIFGEEEFYRKGLKANIDIAKTLFTDWTVRVYCCSKLPKDFIKSIDKPNVEIIIKKQEYNYHGLLWRLLPMQENHDVVIVRDVDTRLFQRDKNLVDDWLETPHKYHICRDNIGSNQPILAGLWGGKKPDLPIQKTWDKWVKNENPKGIFLWDQGYLKKYIYPRLLSDLVVYTEHNIYECERNIKRIPGKREYFEGRLISLGMYPIQDMSDDDDNRSSDAAIEKLGHSYNEGRRKLLASNVEKETNQLNVWYPRWRHQNIFICNFLLLIDIFIKLFRNDIYNIKPWLLFAIKRRIPFLKKTIKSNIEPFYK